VQGSSARFMTEGLTMRVEKSTRRELHPKGVTLSPARKSSYWILEAISLSAGPWTGASSTCNCFLDPPRNRSGPRSALTHSPALAACSSTLYELNIKEVGLPHFAATGVLSRMP
jgi:hypothetical protein